MRINLHYFTLFSYKMQIPCRFDFYKSYANGPDFMANENLCRVTRDTQESKSRTKLFNYLLKSKLLANRLGLIVVSEGEWKWHKRFRRNVSSRRRHRDIVFEQRKPTRPWLRRHCAEKGIIDWGNLSRWAFGRATTGTWQYTGRN